MRRVTLQGVGKVLDGLWNVLQGVCTYALQEVLLGMRQR